MNRKDLENLTWMVPPERQGQAVLVAYAVDPMGLFWRVTDQSVPTTNPERMTYSWVSWDLVEAAEDVQPWNGEPDVDPDAWEVIDA
jgi:hypothetical protein